MSSKTGSVDPNSEDESTDDDDEGKDEDDPFRIRKTCEKCHVSLEVFCFESLETGERAEICKTCASKKAKSAKVTPSRIADIFKEAIAALPQQQEEFQITKNARVVRNGCHSQISTQEKVISSARASVKPAASRELVLELFFLCIKH